MNLPQKVIICEVGPRDGLQSEDLILTKEQKIELIEMVQDSGIKLIEIGSLVSPKAVPQLADTDQVFECLTKRPDVEYRALIMNMKGIERAAQCGIKKAKLTVSVSQAHSLRNANATPAEILNKLYDIMDFAVKNGITLSGALATSFGCSIAGEIKFEDVQAIVAEYVNMGITELSLSDTTGMANPKQVYEYCTKLKQKFPEIEWNLHFHNTRGTGLANVVAGMQAGINRFDASFGGLGGCPFAPGASGNIATEDLVHMCHEMGIETGVDLEKTIMTAKKVRELVGHDTDSFILKAGTNRDLPNLVKSCKG